eukprot:XP_019922300.1 PREDICTED: CD109 antigen-like [Crassostrea gigas]
MWTIVVLVFLATAIAEDTYLVVTPSDVRPGVPLNISINILQSHGNVNVKADLVERSTKNKIATAHGIFSQNVPGILTIQVPDSLGPGSYSLAVHGTHGLKFSNETDLYYQSKSVSIFIQTDKAMYKPGQTVNFRAFVIYPNMSIYTGAMDIEIYDPNTNKIKQILGARDSTGVITNYLEVDTQPVLGDWKIKVTAHGKSSEKTFTIAHYVLPKFEVTVDLPAFALSSDDSLMGTVKAKYTYGKPVEGSVKLRAKNEYWYRPWNYHGDEPMIEQTLTLTNGQAKFTLSGLSTLNKYLDERYIIVEANVTESLTKITLSGNSKIQFHQHAEKMEFLDSNPDTFKPGLPYTAYIRVTRQDGSPITGTKQSVVLHNTISAQLPTPSTTPQFYWGPQTTNYKLDDQTFTLPDTGVVTVQVQIPENATSVSLHAEYGSVSSYKTLRKSYSPSDSYIQLFLRSTTLRAGSVANFEVQSTEGVEQLTYQILSRGSIVHAESVDGNDQQSFTFSVPLTDKMAPNARIVTYYVRTDGEVVTDSISFNVAGVFQNRVALSFDKTKAQPGENVNVRVTADPMSTVYLLAVDQSVLLLKSGNDITQEEVIDELKTYDTIHHYDNGPIFFGGGGGIMPLGRKKRMIWWPYPTYYDCVLTLIQGSLGKVKVTCRKRQIRVWSISFLWRIIECSYFTQILLMTLGCVMILTQGHFGKAKVTGRKEQNSCPVHIFLMDKYWKFLIHIKIAYNLSMCHDIDPRSIEQVQGHCLKYALFRSVSGLAEYGSVSSYKTLRKSFSPSDTYIQLFLRSTTLRAGSVANFEVQSTEGVEQLTYQILSRESIVHAESVDGNNQQSFTFSVPLTDKMAPNARIVTYYVRTDGEVVTDSISFNVAGVFQNRVALSFDKTKAQPGENVNVRVTADPISTVYLLAVDQSVLLLKSGNDITQEEVSDELKTYDTIHHYDNGPIFFGGGGGIMPLGRKKQQVADDAPFE